MTPVVRCGAQVANMWRDPNQVAEFEQDNTFLPLYNGLRAPPATLARYKRNFLRLRKAVFCVGSGPEYDGGIEPWQSAVFGFGDERLGFKPMAQQREYAEDLFGLRTLDTTGRLNVTVVAGAKHSDWTGNESLITREVLPHLT